MCNAIMKRCTLHHHIYSLYLYNLCVLESRYLPTKKTSVSKPYLNIVYYLLLRNWPLKWIVIFFQFISFRKQLENKFKYIQGLLSFLQTSWTTVVDNLREQIRVCAHVYAQIQLNLFHQGYCLLTTIALLRKFKSLLLFRDCHKNCSCFSFCNYFTHL